MEFITAAKGRHKKAFSLGAIAPGPADIGS